MLLNYDSFILTTINDQAQKAKTLEKFRALTSANILFIFPHEKLKLDLEKRVQLRKVRFATSREALPIGFDQNWVVIFDEIDLFFEFRIEVFFELCTLNNSCVGFSSKLSINENLKNLLNQNFNDVFHLKLEKVDKLHQTRHLLSSRLEARVLLSRDSGDTKKFLYRGKKDRIDFILADSDNHEVWILNEEIDTEEYKEIISKAASNAVIYTYFHEDLRLYEKLKLWIRSRLRYFLAYEF